MLIEGSTIVVKSYPENWWVEKSGKKANTYRELSNVEWEQHDIAVDTGFLYSGSTEIEKIKVINKITKEAFERTLTNVTFWHPAGIHILIFSWDSAEIGDETRQCSQGGGEQC